jgi:arginine decarboxylase
VSFEMALRDAGIAHLNLLKVSSIVPPRCQRVEREEGLRYVRPGQIVPVVMAEIATREPGRRIVASIGAALPRDDSRHGFLAEYQAFDQTEAEAARRAEHLAATMLLTALGYHEVPESLRRAEDLPLTLWTATCSAEGQGGDVWTTVVAVAVLL